MDYYICSGPEITSKTLLVSCLSRFKLLPTSELRFRQLFVLQVFNRSNSRPILINRPFITLRSHNPLF